MEDRYSKQERPIDGRSLEDGISELLSKVAAQQSALRTPTRASGPKAPATGAATESEKLQPNIQYIDSQDVRETFADAINAVQFDGQTLRIEFGVTRVKPSDSSNPSAPQVLQRFPACRLVLNHAAVTALNNLMQKIAGGSTKPPAPVGGAKPER
jgi:hypothetical protein